MDEILQELSEIKDRKISNLNNALAELCCIRFWLRDIVKDNSNKFMASRFAQCITTCDELERKHIELCAEFDKKQEQLFDRMRAQLERAESIINEHEVANGSKAAEH